MIPMMADLNQIWHEKGEEKDGQRIRNIISGAVRENKKYPPQHVTGWSVPSHVTQYLWLHFWLV